MNELFQKNISYLATRDRVLAERLIRQFHAEKRWQLVKARDGGWTLEGHDSLGRPLFLHSKYNPQKEAEQLVATYQFSPTADIAILGFGIGYHVCEVLKKESKHGVVFIIEHDIEVFMHACACVDIEAVFRKNNVIFSIGDAPAALFNKVTPYSISVLANNLSVLDHPPSLRATPDFYSAAKKVLADFYTWARVNANTQIAKAHVFAHNIMSNVPEYIMNPGVEVFSGHFSGCPLFIISAGPSLDKNVHYLKEIGDQGIILCVDSALKTLLDNDIYPDLVVSIDFGTHNIKYFDNIPSESLVLVFDPEVHPEIPKRFRGRKFGMNLPGKALCDWITSYIGDKGSISKGLSVSHSTFSLALEMKADPIIFVGQDLSYPRGAWHSKGSGIFQKAGFSHEIKQRMRKIDGYFGGEVTSETSFTVFLNQFESLLDGLSVKCYNATEGGAKIRGVENISLKDAIKNFCTKAIDKTIFQTCLDEEQQKKDFDTFFHAAERMMNKLTEANHVAYKAFLSIERMSAKVKEQHMDKNEIVQEYKKVIGLIHTLSNDQEILQIIKDTAIQALIIRAKRELKNIEDVSYNNKELILNELAKERVFFSTLVNACDFLSQEFCTCLNTLKSRAPYVLHQK
jgi:hypothetical protein